MELQRTLTLTLARPWAHGTRACSSCVRGHVSVCVRRACGRPLRIDQVVGFRGVTSTCAPHGDTRMLVVCVRVGVGKCVCASVCVCVCVCVFGGPAASPPWQVTWLARSSSERIGRCPRSGKNLARHTCTYHGERENSCKARERSEAEVAFESGAGLVKVSHPWRQSQVAQGRPVRNHTRAASVCADRPCRLHLPLAHP